MVLGARQETNKIVRRTQHLRAQFGGKLFPMITRGAVQREHHRIPVLVVAVQGLGTRMYDRSVHERVGLRVVTDEPVMNGPPCMRGVPFRHD
jgi:hypothetical protein